MSCSLNERVGCSNKEEITSQHLFSFAEFLLRFFKIEVDVEGLDEVGNGVGVFIIFLLDDADDVLQLLLVLASVPSATTVRNDGCREISKDPGAGRLYSVNEGCGEKEFTDGVPGRFVVEEREECPVNEPCAVI